MCHTMWRSRPAPRQANAPNGRSGHARHRADAPVQWSRNLGLLAIQLLDRARMGCATPRATVFIVFRVEPAFCFLRFSFSAVLFVYANCRDRMLKLFSSHRELSSSCESERLCSISKKLALRFPSPGHSAVSLQNWLAPHEFHRSRAEPTGLQRRTPPSGQSDWSACCTWAAVA